MEERYVFVTEWFDSVAQITRRFTFTFFPSDNSVELVG